MNTSNDDYELMIPRVTSTACRVGPLMTFHAGETQVMGSLPEL